jgi:hypothetical protein
MTEAARGRDLRRTRQGGYEDEELVGFTPHPIWIFFGRSVGFSLTVKMVEEN